MLMFFPPNHLNQLFLCMDSERERVYFDHDVDKENRSFQIKNLIVISLDFQGSDGTMDRSSMLF